MDENDIKPIDPTSKIYKNKSYIRYTIGSKNDSSSDGGFGSELDKEMKKLKEQQEDNKEETKETKSFNNIKEYYEMTRNNLTTIKEMIQNNEDKDDKHSL